MSDGLDWNNILTRRAMLRGAGLGAAGLAGAALIGCDIGGEKAKEGGTAVFSDALSFETYGSSGGPFSLFTGQATSTEHSGVWDFLMARRHSLDPEPRLAESWEQNDDATSTEVKLHPDLTFHDGKPMNAAAIKRSYESMSEEGTAANQTGTLAGVYVDSMDVVDDRTIRFNHPNWPGPVIFDLLTLAPIHDADNLPDYYETKAVNGRGPFKFDIDSWKPGESWRVVANENYPHPPHLDAIEFRVVPDSDVRAAALENGEVDLAHVDPSQYKRLAGLDHLTGQIGATSGMNVIGPVRTLLGGGHPANDDPRFLRAISKGIDRQSISDEVFEGIASVRSQFFLNNSPAYDEKNNVDYDPDGDRALLDEAGLSGTEIDMFYYTGEHPDSLPEAIQADLKEIGINLNLVEQDIGTFFGQFLKGQHPGMYVLGFGYHWMQIETFLNTNYQVRTSNGVNSVAEVSKDYLELVAAFSKKPSKGVRDNLIKQYTDRFAERPHVIPIVGSEDTWITNNRLKGEANTVRNQYFTNELWIDTDA